MRRLVSTRIWLRLRTDVEKQFKEAATIVLPLTESELTVRLKRGDFVEVSE